MTRLRIVTTATDHPMGVQTYEMALISRAADALGSEWDVEHLVVSSMRSTSPADRRLPIGPLERSPRWVRSLAGRSLAAGTDVVHRMNLSLPPTADEVVTVHDAVAWRFDDEAPPARAALHEVSRARRVICPSAYSAEEVHSLMGVREPVVIHHGVDPRFFEAQPIDDATRTTLGIPGGSYILHSGGASRRKNLEGLAEAWPIVRASRPDVSLVLAGPRHRRRDALFERLPGAIRVGRVDDPTLRSLVAGAAVVTVPSLYEGFGFPVVEAMAAGTPVVAVNRSAVPEVAGDAAVLVEPDGPAIAEGVLALLTDPAAAAECSSAGRRRARQFTWQASVAAHADVWRGGPA